MTDTQALVITFFAVGVIANVHYWHRAFLQIPKDIRAKEGRPTAVRPMFCGSIISVALFLVAGWLAHLGVVTPSSVVSAIWLVVLNAVALGVASCVLGLGRRS